MARGVHVTPGGVMEVVELDQSEGADVLAQLQKQVGGLIESVCLQNGTVMFVNEEGLIRGYWPNAWATSYANRHSGHGDYYIVGEVFLLTDFDPDDEDQMYRDAPERLVEFVSRKNAENPDFRWPGKAPEVTPEGTSPF